MLQSAVGVSEEQLRLVTCALEVTGSQDVAQVYSKAIDILDCILSLVLKEMFSIRSDIVYWEQMSKSNAWENLLFQWNSRVYRTVFFQKEFPHALLENTQDMINHIESLRADFQELSIILAKLYDSIGYLKAIHEVCGEISVFNSRYSMEACVSSLVPDLPAHSTLRHMVYKHVLMCIVKVGECLKEHIPSIMDLHSTSALFQLTYQPAGTTYDFTVPDETTEDTTTPIHADGSSKKADQEEIQRLHTHCHAMQNFLHQVIITRGNQDFPLNFRLVKTQRPSDFERYWVRNILLTIATMLTAKQLYHMIQDGSLQEYISHFIEWMTSKMTEHIIEPITKLGQELFDTIRKRDQIVSREDLEMSKEALERMLSDFSQSKQGYALILPKLKEELLKNKDRILSKEVVEVVSESAAKARASAATDAVVQQSSGAPQIHTIESIRTGNPLKDLSPTPEQALVALMNEYEKELQTPIRGMLFGNLFTALLIQMQKLKVHTEAAMLIMDQILASNELTIAATAAMPAFGLFAYVLFSIRNAFRPRAQVPGFNTLHFSLILSDVERALYVLEELENPSSSQMLTKKIKLQKERVLLLPSSPAKRRAILQSIDPTLDEKDFDFHEYFSKASGHEYLNIHAHNVSEDGDLVDDGCAGACYTPHRTHHMSVSAKKRAERDRTYWMVKGDLSFHLVRLRNKFVELFAISSDVKELLTGKPNKTRNTVTVYHIRHRELIHSSIFLSMWYYGKQQIQSGWNLVFAAYTFLFGSHEIQSITTQFHSLEKDITILEGPWHQVSLARKLETAKRMRMSYKLLSPVHY